MTGAHPAVSSDGPPRAANVLPRRQPGVELMTATAQSIPSGAVVITVRGEVDCCTGPRLQHALLDRLRPAGPPLVVDLTDVGFFGAAGLTVLVTVRAAAVTAGTRLCVVAHTRVVLLPLTITGLDRVFDIYPDLADV
ncbi:STAS domain-containing protein [Actinophytocola sp.]|uniref:STAS domain-containing protein n=1 Tax=Actinophytocola sp. TaxID=1872138 RepID=UPI002ED2C2ED